MTRGEKVELLKLREDPGQIGEEMAGSMSAGDVTGIASFEARLAEGHLTFDFARDLLDALESAIAELGAKDREVAGLRRQLEERQAVVPELTKDDEDAARNDWAKGSPLGTIRFGYNLAISRIRPLSPGEVVATPPPDMVTVPREEWEALRELEHQAWSALDEVENHGECDMTGISGAYKAVKESLALRSAQDSAQRGEG